MCMVCIVCFEYDVASVALPIAFGIANPEREHLFAALT